MKVIYFLVALAISFALPASSAQTGVGSAKPTPDFSGTWQLDRKQSTYLEAMTMPDIHMVISQSGEVLKVARTVKRKKVWVQQLTYYTDGRGEKNPNLSGLVKISSKSSWSDERLVSKYTLSPWLSSTDRYYIQPGTDTWELSSDGEMLTITTEAGEIKKPLRL